MSCRFKPNPKYESSAYWSWCIFLVSVQESMGPCGRKVILPTAATTLSLFDVTLKQHFPNFVTKIYFNLFG